MVTISQVSEAELIEAYYSGSELAIQGMMYYLTIVTGYLVVAHFAGKTLLRRQIVLINTIFVVFSLFSIWGSVAFFEEASYYWHQTAAYQTLQNEEFVTPGKIVGLLEALVILACLNYMREIRARSQI